MKCGYYQVEGHGPCFPQALEGDATFVVARLVEKGGNTRIEKDYLPFCLAHLQAFTMVMLEGTCQALGIELTISDVGVYDDSAG